MEKLSSGLRIARAADDAAGLAVSEKLRGQIRGVNAAVRAQQDSVSGLQVAEGALNEVSSMFTRVKELGIQRSGTSDSDAISAIDSEIEQILKEVDNIETNTEYNGKKILGSSTATDREFSIYTDINGTTATLQITQLNLVTVATGTGAGNFDHSGATVFSLDGDGNTGLTVMVNETAGTGDLGLEVTKESDDTVYANQAVTFGTLAGLTNAEGPIADADDAADYYLSEQNISKNIVKGATYAINEVATIRGQIGSYQNRFEASIRNFEGTAENLQAAESRIRDVDMAKEMVGFTKDTIIQQAAQAMLVQANQLPQNIVGLLR
jgi:flagellin